MSVSTCTLQQNEESGHAGRTNWHAGKTNWCWYKQAAAMPDMPHNTGAEATTFIHEVPRSMGCIMGSTVAEGKRSHSSSSSSDSSAMHKALGKGATYIMAHASACRRDWRWNDAAVLYSTLCPTCAVKHPEHASMLIWCHMNSMGMQDG